MSFRNPTTGGGGGMPSATDSTIVDVPNPYDAGHTMHMVQFPEDQMALAFGIEGDDFPRILFLSDPTDAIFFVGDGTFDPTSGIEIFYDANNQALVFPKSIFHGDVDLGGHTLTGGGTVPLSVATASGQILVTGNPNDVRTLDYDTDGEVLLGQAGLPTWGLITDQNVYGAAGIDLAKTVIVSPDSTVYKIVVADDGTLSTTPA